MDYEKKYKEALERARNLHKDAIDMDENVRAKQCEIIFPELKESENEKVRKEIMDFIDTKTIDSDERRNRWFSYLEKYKPISFTSLDDTEVKMSLMQYISELNQDVVHLHPGIETCNEWLAWLKKQGEQKPADSYCQEHCKGFQETGKCFADGDCEAKKEAESVDKAKPKFKVGDFILNDYCMGKVIEVTNDAYLLDSGQGIPFSCEHNAHLWTLEDAKDGDVLYFDDNTIVIFKDLYNATTFHSYCHIEDGVFDISKDDMPDWWEGKGFHPATKEQRDILFAKMKEAGYEWDAEKKELKIKLKEPDGYGDNIKWSDTDKLLMRLDKIVDCNIDQLKCLNNIFDKLNEIS